MIFESQGLSLSRVALKCRAQLHWCKKKNTTLCRITCRVLCCFFTSVFKPSPFLTLQELKHDPTLGSPRLVPETEVSESYTCCTGTAVNTLILIYIQMCDWILASVPPASPQNYFIILSRIFHSIWLNYPHGTGAIHSLTDTSVSTLQPLS